MPRQKNFDVEATLGKVIEAFWFRGYQATSMQDLVDCAGVNRASFYATYGDKRALFLAALRRYDETVLRRSLAEIEARFRPREAIYRKFRTVVDSVAAGKRNVGCFITNSALELAAHDPEVAAIVAKAQAELEAFFVRSIARGQAAGEIAASVDPASTAQALLAMFLGMRVLSRSRPDPKLLQTIAEQSLRCLD